MGIESFNYRTSIVLNVIRAIILFTLLLLPSSTHHDIGLHLGVPVLFSFAAPPFVAYENVGRNT